MKRKVRIKSLPPGYHMMPDGTIMRDDQHMAMGGSVAKTLAPVPRNQANLEAEKGETVVTNLTGDSVIEHYTVGGKRHSAGGTPLNLPPGSFVFSDTKKMKIKDPEILKHFGALKPATPAKLAKKYDVNKIKNSLYEDGTVDPVETRTREMMLDNYKKKLSELAFVQESMKGFPQGIPAIAGQAAESMLNGPVMAAYGGYLPKAQKGLTVTQAFANSDKGKIVKSIVNSNKGDANFINLLNRWQVAGPERKEEMLKENPRLESALRTALNLPSSVQQVPTTAPAIYPAPSSQQYSPMDLETTIQVYGNDPTYVTPAQQQQQMQQAAQQSTVPSTTPSSGTTPSPKVRTNNSSRAIPEGLSEEEYKILMDQLSGVSSSGRGGKRRVLTSDNYSYADKKKLAASLTLLGFGDKSPFYQGLTPGYKHFYGGMKPGDYERRIVEEMYGEDALTGLSNEEIRQKAYQTMGIDLSPEMLKRSEKDLYNDEAFLKDYFYPLFTSLLPEGTYRPDQGNDFKIGFEHFDAIRPKDTPEETPVETPVKEVPKEEITPGKISETKETQDPGFFWAQDKIRGFQDLRNRLGLRRYDPRNFRMDPVITPPTFYSPQREIAATEEAANAVTSSLAAFAGPQGLSTRASQIQGTGAAQVADIQARYNNQNVGVANNDVLRRDALMNTAAEFNTKGLSDFYDKQTIAKQSYDNAKRALDENIANTTINALTNAVMTKNLNSLFPQFNIDPTSGGIIYFDEAMARDIAQKQLESNMSDWEVRRQQFTDMVEAGVPKEKAADYIFGSGKSAPQAFNQANVDALLQQQRTAAMNAAGYNPFGQYYVPGITE